MRSKRHEFETYVAEGAWLVVTHLLHRESRQETVVNPYLTNCTRETSRLEHQRQQQQGRSFTGARKEQAERTIRFFSPTRSHHVRANERRRSCKTGSHDRSCSARALVASPAVAEIPVATDAVVAPPEHAFSTGMREAQCGQVGSDFRLDLFPMGSNPAFPVGGEVVDEGEGDSQLELPLGRLGISQLAFKWSSSIPLSHISSCTIDKLVSLRSSPNWRFWSEVHP